MIDIRPLDAHFAVAPQIALGDMPAAAAAGYAAIVNNRPDDEEAGQPAGDAVRAAAADAGLGYSAIPVTSAGFSLPQVDALVAAIEQAEGPVLAFCRSGTRSTNLWALARARMGDDADVLTAKAAAAGYDIAALRPLLDQLAASR